MYVLGDRCGNLQNTKMINYAKRVGGGEGVWNRGGRRGWKKEGGCRGGSEGMK